MKLSVQKADLNWLSTCGFIGQDQVPGLWDKLSERCPVIQERTDNDNSQSGTKKEIEIPPLNGTLDSDSTKYDMCIAYSMDNGGSIARKLFQGLTKREFAVTLACDDVFDAHTIEKRVANSTSLIVVLTANSLKQKEVVFAMTAAKFYYQYPSLVILVHDAGSCFFPGYDEQPDSLKDFFSEKAITFLSCYTKEGVREIIAKFVAESEVLKNAKAAQTANPVDALLDFLAKKEDQKSFSVQEIRRRMKGIVSNEQLESWIAEADANKNGEIDATELATFVNKIKDQHSKHEEENHEDLTTRVFLSHKRSTGQGIAGRLYEGLKDHYKVFIDSEAKFKIHNLRQIVESTEVFVFILSNGIFLSKWCLEELKSALDYKKKVIIVRELSFAMPLALPHDWLCVENVVRSSDEIVWMAEYNTACIEALRKRIGPKDATKSYIQTKDLSELPPILAKMEETLKKTGILELPFEWVVYYVPQNLLESAKGVTFGASLGNRGVPPKDGNPAMPPTPGMPCQPGPEELKFVSQHVPDLELFGARSGWNLNSKAVEPILVECGDGLKHLSLPGSKVGDASFWKALPKLCPKLEYLNVQKCILQDISSLASIPTLKHLNISENTALPTTTLTALAELPLETLNIRGCSRLGGDSLGDLLSTGFSNLKNLLLGGSGFSKFSDEGVKKITSCSFNLKSLVLNQCPDLTDESIISVSERYPDLESLELKESDITDAGIEALVKNCPKITKLNLHSCKKITDKGVALIASNLHNLETLFLAHNAITDAVFTNLAEGCKNLKHLYITHERLTDKAIENFAVAGGGASLTRLDVSGCILFTDEVIRVASQYFTNVEHLEFQYCREISANSIPYFLKFQKLSTIRMYETKLLWYQLDDLLPHVHPFNDAPSFWAS